MRNIDSYTHTRGESVYLDDIPVMAGTLYAACFDSPVAHGRIVSLDVREAEKSNGVVGVLTYKDIRGVNQIGGIVPDEPLLAEHHVHFCGMPVALVLATSDKYAREAVKKIKVDIEPLEVITDPRVAAAKGELIVPPRKFVIGDVENAWKDCAHIFEGKADTKTAMTFGILFAPRL